MSAVEQLPTRILLPLAEAPECAAMPLKYEANALHKVRPDQMPRFLGAITHPELNEKRTFAFDEVTAVQNRVSIEKVEQLAKKEPVDTGAIIAELDGGLYILDGHHRIVAAWLRGDENFTAHFIDLKEVSHAMKSATVLKVDTSLGLVFGWAIVCKLGGEDYFDTQGDHIPEPVMLKASTEFMGGDRIGGDMHVWSREGIELHPGQDYTGADPVQTGDIVFAFPMTTDIAKSLGITVDRSGLLVAYKPATPELLAKFASGDYTGFSIGGFAVSNEVLT